MVPGLQDRRVQRLRLTAAVEDDLWRARVLLEDAFHTASLPGIPAGRLIVVKQFSIGRLSTRHGSAALARIIDDRFLELASEAVYADHPSAASRSVVYFRDEVEPFVKLAIRIAADQETSSWFWPLAAKGWRPAMSKREGLRAILFRVAESRAGVAGIVVLIGELRRMQLLEPLLTSLETADAHRLLQLCRWPEPSAESATESGLDAGIPTAAQAVLIEWVKRWTRTDLRLIWLAAVLLIEQKPTRLLDRQLIQRAMRLIEVVSNKTSRAELFSVEEKTTPLQSYPRRGTPDHGEAIVHENDVVATPATRWFADNESGRPLDIDVNAVSTRHYPSDEAKDIDSFKTTSSQPLEPSVLSISARTCETPVPAIDATACELVARDPTPEPDELTLTWANNPQLTEFGGFFFLIRLLNRLRLGDFLEAHPQLTEFDFPKRLLRFLAGELQIPDSDPVRTQLRESEDVELPKLEFSVPQIWREQLYRSGALLLSTIKGRPGYRMLTDRSERSILAIWHGRAPDVRRLIGTSVVARTPPRQCEDDLGALLSCWHRALLRWCRCFARIGLHDLVRRRGLLSVTRTHVDLFFDLNSVDMRVRRSGLDLDPGWVPWFARVVSFHYLEQDEIDGRE